MRRWATRRTESTAKAILSSSEGRRRGRATSSPAMRCTASLFDRGPALIEGNRVGLNRAGTAALGNAIGVQARACEGTIQIGGETPADAERHLGQPGGRDPGRRHRMQQRAGEHLGQLHRHRPDRHRGHRQHGRHPRHGAERRDRRREQASIGIRSPATTTTASSSSGIMRR